MPFWSFWALKEQAFTMRVVIVISRIIFGFKETAYTIRIVVVFLTIILVF